jgi:Rho termination factor-like protein
MNAAMWIGKQAAKARQRGGEAGHALEDRNREQLYEIAKKQNIRGRSKMGKWDLIKAIRKSR